MASLPYVPTWILSSHLSSNLVYILQPSGSNSGKFELLALNTTQAFESTNLPLDTLSPTLPFLNDGQNEVITPAIDDQGNILVYTGDCRKGTQGSALWQFTPNKKSLNGNGTWQELPLSANGIGTADISGANYLASAIAFSSITNATAEMYVFGGMCPNATQASTPSDWTQNAEYSNNMLAMRPSQSSPSSTPYYDLGISSARGPPIAEAGFTITSLAPTFFESSDNQTQSQNQNFVLIGGHTQQAFINTSQIALFSLPEQSWSFLPVDAPSSPPPTDLAARAVTSIDSRSGHTATLSADGKKVIVFGGWVGDVTNPADPQLAVVELGQGYGGSGDCQWAVPIASGSGLSAGTGIYGHGAAMIAGDVLLIMGGYEIPSFSGSKRRRATPSANTNNYLFNTTSSSWISNYDPSKVSRGRGVPNGEDQNETKTNERVGLGVGLTLGILALIIVVVVYFWYSRRLKRRRDARDDELRKLAAGAQRFHLNERDEHGAQVQPQMTTVDLVGNGNSAVENTYPWKSNNPTQSMVRSDRSGPEAARTGLLFEIPSPTRGLRRSLHSRGTYQPAPWCDDGRRGQGVSTIHPIDERDEYDEGVVDEDNVPSNNMIYRRDYQLLNNVPVLDPFRDSAEGSRTPSPQSPQEREREIRGWVNGWNEADVLMHSGRLSPEKTDRTSSTLSDMSARSMQSYNSIQQSVGTVSRTVSQRSAALFSGPLRSTNDTSPRESQQGYRSSFQQGHDHRRSRSLTTPVMSDAVGSTSPSFPQLQFESEALLGDYGGSGDTSPTKIGRRAKGWMGSVRRALIGNDRSSSTSPENNGTSSSSPTKHDFIGAGIPRRAASTGHPQFWQKRQGAKDWEIEGGRPSDETIMPRKMEGEEDWDVESAVERRVVQVMFTVPKEKLRVVNKGPDGDGESVMSSKYEDAVEGDGEEGEGEGKGKEREE